MQKTDEKLRVATLFQSVHRYKYLDSFITLFVVVLIVSNIVASKFFAIGSASYQRCADTFPDYLHIDDIFTEVYGYGASRRAI
jgi:uncharacterized PurR-regulated membrane protein YhhQ (DUF165 family)